MLEKIKDRWQIYTVIFIFWCFFDLYEYYLPFGIEIQNYISGKEIVFLLLPAVIKGTCSYLFVFMFFAITNPSAFFISEGKIMVNETIDRPWSDFTFLFKDIYDTVTGDLSIIKKCLLILFNLVGIVMLFLSYLFIIGLMVGVVYQLYFNKGHSWWAYFGYVEKYALIGLFSFFCILPVLSFVSHLFYKSTSPFFNSITMGKTILPYIVFLFIVDSLISNRIDYSLVVEGKGTKRVSFEYKDKIISTNDSLNYVGETESVMFLYNKADSSNLIFQTKDISNLKIKRLTHRFQDTTTTDTHKQKAPM